MRQFQIPEPLTTTMKSIRFPNELLERVEAVIRGKGITFSAFVIAALRFALESCEPEQPRSDAQASTRCPAPHKPF